VPARIPSVRAEAGGPAEMTLASPPRSRVADAALFGAAAAVSGFTLLRGVNYHDEGLMLQAAARVAHGQWPYKDFWWYYGPGQPLVLAGFQKVFGPSLLTWRLLRVAQDALVGVLAFRLVLRNATVPFALVAFTGVAGAMTYSTDPGPNAPALALALGALLVAGKRPVLAGAMIGIAALFRLEIGLAGALGTLLIARRGALRAGVAVTLVIAIAYLPFAAVAGPSDLVDSTLGFALGKQHLQRLPLPLAYHGALNPKELFDFYYPAVLLVGLALWILAAAWQRTAPPLIGAAPLAAAGATYLVGRPDTGHLIFLAVTLPLLLTPAVTAALRERQRAWAIVLGVPLVLVVLHGVAHRVAALVNPPTLAPLQVDVADGVRVTPSEARSLRRVASVVDERAPPDQPIFVANPRHDILRVGNPLLYVLLDRSNPTRYDVMQPGVVTTAPVQREMVDDLERTRPAVVVRWLARTAQRREPNGAGRSSGVRILDRYLLRRYREISRFGDYAILSRRRK
jgi:hypothetical protein